MTVPLSGADLHHRLVTGGRASGDTGPGILETAIVIGAAALVAGVVVLFFGGQLAQIIGVLVDIAHGGH